MIAFEDKMNKKRKEYEKNKLDIGTEEGEGILPSL